MATADVDICNIALARIGEKQPLATLNDNRTTAALCKTFYGQTRDAVLSEFPWPFASKHQALARLSVARSGWMYAYAAPSDMLAPQYVFSGARPGSPIALSSVINNLGGPFISPVAPLSGMAPVVPFAVEAGDSDATTGIISASIILCDLPAPELVYTANGVAVNAFPPMFVDAVAWRLAMELALALPVKAGLSAQMAKLYEVSLLKAQAAAFRQEQEDSQPDAAYIAQRG